MEARGLSSEVVHHIDFAAVDSAASQWEHPSLAAAGEVATAVALAFEERPEAEVVDAASSVSSASAEPSENRSRTWESELALVVALALASEPEPLAVAAVSSFCAFAATMAVARP